MRQLVMQIVLAGAVLICAVTYGFAAERVALVIGNSAYEHLRALETPVNDAQDIATALKGLGFEVVEGHNLDVRQTQAKIRNFHLALDGAKVALVFYAGHGIQVDSKNYLLPVSAKLKDEIDLSFGTVALDTILKAMPQEGRVSLVFVDACRTNPLVTDLSRSLANKTRVKGIETPNIGKGLAAIEADAGTLISLSASPGHVCVDGSGRNSRYTRALLNHISAPNQSLRDILASVQKDVLAFSNGKQRTWESVSLTGEFFFSTEKATGSITRQVRVASTETGLKPESGEVPKKASSNEKNLRSRGLQRLSLLEPAKKKSEAKAIKPDHRVVAKAQQDAKKLAALKKAELVEKVLLDTTSVEPVPSKKKIVKPEAIAPVKKTVEPVKEARTSATTPQEPAKTDQGPKTTKVLDEKGIVIALQKELERVGCSPGKIDGIWGRNSRGALSAFALHSEIDLKSINPTLEILDLVKGKSKRVCPLVCDSEESAADGKCIVYDCPPGTHANAPGDCVPVTVRRKDYLERRYRYPGDGGYGREPGGYGGYGREPSGYDGPRDYRY